MRCPTVPASSANAEKVNHDANMKSAGEAGEKLSRQTKDILDTNVKAAGEAGDKLAAAMTSNPKKAA